MVGIFAPFHCCQGSLPGRESVARALQGLVGERATEVSPALKKKVFTYGVANDWGLSRKPLGSSSPPENSLVAL